MTGIRAGVHSQPSGGEADRLPGTACYPAGHAALSGNIALTREPGTECAWTPHPYYTSYCLLIVTRRAGCTIFFDVPAPT
jgi:hypothetical protein